MEGQCSDTWQQTRVGIVAVPVSAGLCRTGGGTRVRMYCTIRFLVVSFWVRQESHGQVKSIRRGAGKDEAVGRGVNGQGTR